MLTSRDNPMVKLCRRLQTGAKARREEGLFLAEGVSAGRPFRQGRFGPSWPPKPPWTKTLGLVRRGK